MKEISDALRKCLSRATGKPIPADAPMLDVFVQEAERRLQEAGEAYFKAHPDLTRAFYALYVHLVGKAPKLEVKLVIAVGMEQVEKGLVGAYARLMFGELERNVVKRDV